VSQALELFGFSKTKGMRKRTASRASDAVTRRSRLPSSTFAWSFSLKFGNPDRPGPPSRRGPGPEWVSRLAIDQDVQGKPIHKKRTRPRRMSRSNRLRFLSTSKSASGPSMMSQASQSIPCRATARARRALPEKSSTTFLPSKAARRQPGGAAKRRGTSYRGTGPRLPRGAVLVESLFLPPAEPWRGPRSASGSSRPPNVPSALLLPGTGACAA